MALKFPSKTGASPVKKAVAKPVAKPKASGFGKPAPEPDDEPAAAPAAKAGRPSRSSVRLANRAPEIDGHWLKSGIRVIDITRIEQLSLSCVQGDKFEVSYWLQSGKSTMGRQCTEAEAIDEMNLVLDAIKEWES